MLVADSSQMRSIDRQMIENHHLPGLLLMETAGRKSADYLLAHYPDIGHFLVCCGPGNNGGDGLVTARYLAWAGKKVLVIFSHPAEGMKGEARTQLEIILHHPDIQVLTFSQEAIPTIRSFLSEGAVIIDALLGTGVNGKVEEPILSVLNFFRGMRQIVVALDVPSGLSCDTGSVLTAPIKCEATLAIQLPKVCHYVTPASPFCGKVTVIDIGMYPKVLDNQGIRYHVMTDDLVREWHRPREQDVHKGTYGHTLLAGGSKGKGGAIALSANAATEIGAGLCTAFIPGSVACSFHRTTLENMSIPYGNSNVPYLNETSAEVFISYLKDKSVVGIGPGLGNNNDTFQFLRNVLPEIKQPLVLDADALNLLAEYPELWEQIPVATPVILTPHPGEMSRLSGISTEEIQQNRIEKALEFATQRNIYLILKGAGTIVAAPTGEVYISANGNPGMATGGSGDALVGVVAGLISQGYPILQATAMGVYLHAAAGDVVMSKYGHEGVTATKLIRNLGTAWRRILQPDSAMDML